MKAIAKVLILTLLSGCASQEARDRWVLLGAAALVGAAAYAAARNSGGGAPLAASDYDWDWDAFYNQYGQLVWACRGVQTTQFAEQWHGAGKAQTDYRWPNK